jgi:flagellar hook-associated protein 2
MATITSAGLGSGLDIESLITQLVSAEKTPETRRLDLAEARVQAEVSALGNFKSVLSSLQSAVAALQSGGAVTKLSATSANKDLFTASASSTATPGTYSVEVLSIAVAQKLKSTGFDTTAAAAVGTGTLTLAVGAESFSINLTSGSNSLAAIRDAINNAADNKGVVASIVTGDDGAHLVLTSTKTGTANELKITQSGGDGGLASLVYDPGVLENLAELQPAANAQVVIDGVTYTGSSNAINDAISGVSLNLLDAEIGTAVTLTVARDTKSATDAINAFVKAYNTTVTTISSLTRYDPATKTAGALIGDPTVVGLTNRMRQILGSQVAGVPGGLSTLAELGITTNVDGTFKVDDGKLASAISKDPSAVATLFTSSGGFGTKLGAAFKPYLEAEGLIKNETDTAQKALDDIEDRRDALARRLSSLEKTYRAQFTALDTLVAQLQSTSNFLTQQLANLASLANPDSSS